MTLKVAKVSEARVKVDATRWEELLDRKAVLEEIALTMWVKANEAFDDQGRPEGTWSPRFAPNFAGIVNRLNRGLSPRASDFEPKPALHDTGRLKNSLAHRVRGNVAEVGTNVPYATRMQEGGPSEITLTPQGQERLGKWLRKNRSNRYYQENLGWLFGKPSFTVDVQARPFLVVTEEDVAEYAEIVAQHIEAAQ